MKMIIKTDQNFYQNIKTNYSVIKTFRFDSFDSVLILSKQLQDL